MKRALIPFFALTCWCFLQTSISVSAQTTNSYPASGNVGIGTTSPPWKLTIVTSQPGDGLLFGTTSAATNPHNLGVMINLAGGWNNLVQPGDHMIMSQGSNVDATDAGGIVLGTWSNSATGLRMAPNGNVGIGVSIPQDKLAVNGGITAKKVTVTLTGWSDYVFQPDYDLRPLAEVGRYIRENHHLPDLPSSGEIQLKGLNLGDNQALLLRKIEELTLYLLEQDKKLKEKDEQIRQLNGQAKRIDQLERRLAELEEGK